MPNLKITQLQVKIFNKTILNGIDLVIEPKDIIAVMGPNGQGKSTLLKTVMGHPDCEVVSGKIELDNEDLTALKVDERSAKGIFLAFQQPVEIPGVKNADFLSAIIKIHQPNLDFANFILQTTKLVEELKLPNDFLERDVNVGFSGGEKKKSEIIQLISCKPQIAMLDEIDSGLDVDAMTMIANQLNKYISQSQKSLVIVSHYDRFFKLLKPNKCIVINEGKIVASGGYELVEKIDRLGYSFLGIKAAASVSQDDLGAYAKKNQ